MTNQIKAVIVDDDTISIDGRTLVEGAELAAVLRSAMQRDPGMILIIEPRKPDDYKGIGKVIYASQAAGVPVESLRFTMEDGEVLTFEALRARHSKPSE
jgi:hypothetical protein